MSDREMKTSTGRPSSPLSSQMSTGVLDSNCSLKDSSPKSILELPLELQVNLLTYLRAYDLANVQQTCRFYNNTLLVDRIVRHAAERVYTPELTAGFDQQPVNYSKMIGSSTNGSANANQKHSNQQQYYYYTFEHLRNMELMVIARVLTRPEPKTHGFLVSKSWCKAALKWLEVRSEETSGSTAATTSVNKKRVSKKKQRLRSRRLSDVTPPWPNANSDLLCPHDNLVVLSKKSARARRRLLDKQSWTMLRKLYPDTHELDSRFITGDCWQCQLEADAAKNAQQSQVAQAKLERKRPLDDEDIRHLYTRTRGVPTQALVQHAVGGIEAGTKRVRRSPLVDGTYYVIPRAWCHGWRRYIKTGEGFGQSSVHPQPAVGAVGGGPQAAAWKVPPPNASCLWCDAHRMPLVPPHLEAYLSGENGQLLVSSGSVEPRAHGNNSETADDVASRPVVGQGPDPSIVQALQAAGLSPAEVSQQLAAMRLLEQQNQQQPQPYSSLRVTKNELLDRENHCVVEIVTKSEYEALERFYGVPADFLSFCVSNDGADFDYTAIPCRSCDATGAGGSGGLCVKNRARGWVRKNVVGYSDATKQRAPARSEY